MRARPTRPTVRASEEASKRETEIALAEFNALRAEILSYAQAQAGTFAAALTAAAAIGSITLAKGGPPELLLAIPLVLSGLGLLHTDLSRRSYLLGHYIKSSLWRSPGPLRRPGTSLTSWEDEVRRLQMNFRPLDKAAAVAPFALILVVPSLGVLAYAPTQLVGGPWKPWLWIIFGLAAALLIMYMGLAYWVHLILRVRLDSPGASRTAGRGGRPE